MLSVCRFVSDCEVLQAAKPEQVTLLARFYQSAMTFISDVQLLTLKAQLKRKISLVASIQESTVSSQKLFNVKSAVVRISSAPSTDDWNDLEAALVQCRGLRWSISENDGPDSDCAVTQKFIDDKWDALENFVLDQFTSWGELAERRFSMLSSLLDLVPEPDDNSKRTSKVGKWMIKMASIATSISIAANTYKALGTTAEDRVKADFDDSGKKAGVKVEAE